MELVEFENTLRLDDLLLGFQRGGYSDDFIDDLIEGFATSEIYCVINCLESVNNGERNKEI